MSRFTNVIETLLEGKVVCSVAFPNEHHYLSDPANYLLVDQYLRQIDRSIATTSDNAGYLMVFKGGYSAAKKRQLASVFKEVESQLSVIIGWLRFARNVAPDSNPLAVGETLNESELLAAIESSRPLSDELTAISNKLGRSIKSTEVKRKLSSVLAYLCEQDFLINMNQTGSVYQATAKWSLIYDLMEFYIHREGTDLEAASLNENQLGMEL
ncbi:hypothetical protein [Photobacterium leiognathi]|uniref:hypothetical protein n=1 Tax=Photobacterium leiognathi TaxID=553611 RepID=UPI002981D33E|nr:hypothetical protein [Photobacterium leiognathi]